MRKHTNLCGFYFEGITLYTSRELDPKYFDLLVKHQIQKIFCNNFCKNVRIFNGLVGTERIGIMCNFKVGVA